jgi:uncharacterized protein (TIGR00369 family)
MNKQEVIDGLNGRNPKFIKMLGGSITDIDRQSRTCTYEFNISTDFCHSTNIVQGGFITSMLDAAMSHAVFAETEGKLKNVSSLEIKTSFLEPTHAGRLTAVGKVMKSSYKTAFLEAQLFNELGVLTATASSVAKLIRPK